MNIVMRYLGVGIEGIPLKQFKSILQDKDTIRINVVGKGIMVLNNKKVIKCVEKYYRNPNAEDTAKIKASNQCYYIQKNMNITGVSNYSCRECHLRCMDMHEERSLLLK